MCTEHEVPTRGYEIVIRYFPQPLTQRRRGSIHGGGVCYVCISWRILPSIYSGQRQEERKRVPREVQGGIICRQIHWRPVFLFCLSSRVAGKVSGEHENSTWTGSSFRLYSPFIRLPILILYPFESGVVFYCFLPDLLFSCILSFPSLFSSFFVIIQVVLIHNYLKNLCIRSDI